METFVVGSGASNNNITMAAQGTTKQALRKHMKTILKNMPSEVRLQKSKLITEKVAVTVLIFYIHYFLSYWNILPITGTVIYA